MEMTIEKTELMALLVLDTDGNVDEFRLARSESDIEFDRDQWAVEFGKETEVVPVNDAFFDRVQPAYGRIITTRLAEMISKLEEKGDLPTLTPYLDGILFAFTEYEHLEAIGETALNYLTEIEIQ